MSQPSHRAAARLHAAWARNKLKNQLALIVPRFAQESHSLGDDSQIETAPPKGDAT